MSTKISLRLLLAGLKELTVVVVWQLISSHTTFMSTRLLTISGGMLGSRGCPAGPASICGGAVPVGLELQFEKRSTTTPRSDRWS